MLIDRLGAPPTLLQATMADRAQALSLIIGKMDAKLRAGADLETVSARRYAALSAELRHIMRCLAPRRKLWVSSGGGLDGNTHGRELGIGAVNGAIGSSPR